jgi:hypothetical protein
MATFGSRTAKTTILGLSPNDTILIIVSASFTPLQFIYKGSRSFRVLEFYEIMTELSLKTVHIVTGL